MKNSIPACIIATSSDALHLINSPRGSIQGSRESISSIYRIRSASAEIERRLGWSATTADNNAGLISWMGWYIHPKQSLGDLWIFQSRSGEEE